MLSIGRLYVPIMPLTSLTWDWTQRFVADVRVEDILYLGDTRSADDLAVFTKMAPERLCLGCGLRVDEPFAPLATGERKKLFYAAQKLLMFVLHEVSAQTFSEEEAALKAALMPLLPTKMVILWLLSQPCFTIPTRRQN